MVQCRDASSARAPRATSRLDPAREHHRSRNAGWRDRSCPSPKATPGESSIVEGASFAAGGVFITGDFFLGEARGRVRFRPNLTSLAPKLWFSRAASVPARGESRVSGRHPRKGLSPRADRRRRRASDLSGLGFLQRDADISSRKVGAGMRATARVDGQITRLGVNIHFWPRGYDDAFGSHPIGCDPISATTARAVLSSSGECHAAHAIQVFV